MKTAITLMRAALLWAGVAILMLCNPYRASAQSWLDNFELGGGFSHASGDFGLNGFNAAAGYWVNRRVSLNMDYDWLANNSTLNVLSMTSLGHTAVKNRMQDWMVGPRVFFPPRKLSKFKLDPFGELFLGGAHQSQQVTQASIGQISASANSFAWALGGGTDYQFNSQWFGRVSLDFMRTHFADAGQNRFRFVLGVGYTFGPRGGGK